MANEAFVWGRGGRKLTPDQVEKERENAALLAKAAMDYSPVAHWSQGLNRVAQGILAGIDYRRADKAEGEIADVNKGLISDAIKSVYGGAPASSSAIPSGGAAGEIAATAPATDFTVDPTIKSGIAETATALGISPADLATAISYETAGTFDPMKAGPATKWGQHKGLIQFGEPQAQQYGVDWANPIGSQLGAEGAVAKYLREAGVEPGMGLIDIYSAINAGKVGRYDASDAAAGGAPGTVADKVNQQMAGHRAKALALFPEQVAAATPEAAIEAISPTQGGSLTDEVAAFEQTPAYTAQFPGQTVGAQGDVPPLSAPVGVPTLPVAGPQDAVTQAITQQPVEVAGGGDRQSINPAIIEALTNPQASPQTQRVAAILLEQEQRRMQAAEEQRLQAADPMRRMELEKGQIELERLRNPQAGFRTLTQDEKKQYGLPPNGAYQIDRDGKIAQIGGGGVTVNNEGSIPAGYQAIRDPEGRVMSIEPIPGSPAALAADQAQRTIETQGGRKETATDVITGAATNARNILKDSWFTTGTPGRIAANLSESPAAELRRQVDVLKSNATIENLTAMRQASPTGGALGSVTEKEGAMLAAAAGAIDPNASKPDVEKSLDTYERTLLRVIHGPKVGDAIFEQTRVEKPISEMTDEELEALANGD